ncbi:dTDP-4-dehydrorhamnose reductase [Marinobacterium sediminicola]|uniref:dTDP-4-dehydrorhamnose reductase n=1 Tax=Marinobacterium sediminicola TaxID=518898 RepID=A0ABY1RZF5_9GAMM|nr:dTDP-4-dehydrorhamnose reductase [Marinobacterium sediminicola]ULG69003.1 dTDP-4-dehydrorhamnose reductase [Marinobacterium sediminicola]SMR73778.1 dTDP-4-dehydrorhamnose reductase [Marinobacterium sediminicola]
MPASAYTTSAKVLIVGAAGQVGHALTELLEQASGVEPVALGRRQLDITDPAAVRKQLEKHLPDYVINCAGFNRVDAAERQQDQALSINRDGAHNLALATAALSIPLLHLSSDYVFDGHYASGYGEEDEASPLGVFGRSKWLGEEAIRAAQPQHLILRISWVFSARGENFLLRTLEQARHDSLIEAADDRRGCPTSAEDVARVLLAILRQLTCGIDVWGTYHYCGAEITTRYGFSEAILAAARQYEELKVERLQPVASSNLQALAQRPASSVLKCRKLLSTFGIRQRPWRSELQRVIREIYGEL